MSLKVFDILDFRSDKILKEKKYLALIEQRPSHVKLSHDVKAEKIFRKNLQNQATFLFACHHDNHVI